MAVSLGSEDAIICISSPDNNGSYDEQHSVTERLPTIAATDTENTTRKKDQKPDCKKTKRDQTRSGKCKQSKEEGKHYSKDHTARISHSSYLISTALNLIHIIVNLLVYTFGLLRVQDGLFVTRNALEAYITNGHTSPTLSALPEFLIFPPFLTGLFLSSFYSFILKQFLLGDSTILATQRDYTYYSLITPIPHTIFVLFTTIDVVLVYFASHNLEKGTLKQKQYYFVFVCVVSVVNMVWLVSFMLYFPSFRQYRSKLVAEETHVIEDTWDHIHQKTVASKAAIGNGPRISKAPGLGSLQMTKRGSFHGFHQNSAEAALNNQLQDKQLIKSR